MPSPRETILAALHVRLSALPAKALHSDVPPERVPVAGLLILRDGQPGELEVTLSSSYRGSSDGSGERTTVVAD